MRHPSEGHQAEYLICQHLMLVGEKDLEVFHKRRPLYPAALNDSLPYFWERQWQTTQCLVCLEIASAVLMLWKGYRLILTWFTLALFTRCVDRLFQSISLHQFIHLQHSGHSK